MRHHRYVTALLVFGFVFGLTMPAGAQQKDIGVQPTTGAGRQAGYADSWALVIGINQYRHPGIEKLQYAVNDAQAMEAVLPSLGFSRVIRLLDQDATKARIEQELYGTLKQMGPNDRLLIFFSGHGKRVELPKGGDEAWLMPVDADPTTPERTGIPLHEFDRIGRRLPAKHVLFIFDNCYSGFAFLQPKSIPPTRRDAFFAAQTSSPVIQALTAGKSGEVAYEAQGQGLFTRRLIEGLRGSADRDNDGLITAGELLTFVQPQVSRDTNGQQTPQGGRLSGEGEFIFVRSGVPVPSGTVSLPPPLPQASALDEERRRLEEERRRLEAEKALLEERKKLEAERQALEEQRKRLGTSQGPPLVAVVPTQRSERELMASAIRTVKEAMNDEGVTEDYIVGGWRICARGVNPQLCFSRQGPITAYFKGMNSADFVEARFLLETTYKAILCFDHDRLESDGNWIRQSLARYRMDYACFQIPVKSREELGNLRAGLQVLTGRQLAGLKCVKITPITASEGPC